MIPIYLHCIPIIKAFKKAVLKMFGSSVIFISFHYSWILFFYVLVNNIVNKLFVVINAYKTVGMATYGV